MVIGKTKGLEVRLKQEIDSDLKGRHKVKASWLNLHHRFIEYNRLITISMSQLGQSKGLFHLNESSEPVCVTPNTKPLCV